jgi:hypothetical protein
VGDGGFEHGEELALVAGEGAADKGGAELDGQGAGIDGGEIVDDAGFEREPMSAVAENWPLVRP